MPTTPQKQLQDFLLELMEKPRALRLLKTDPRQFIANAALSGAHKKILLSNDKEKIKEIVARAVGTPTFAMNIGVAGAINIAPGQPMDITAGDAINIRVAEDFNIQTDDGFHMVFGAESSTVQISLRPKAKASKGPPWSKKSEVIHIQPKQKTHFYPKQNTRLYRKQKKKI